MSEKLGVCYFDLYTVDKSPIRATYNVDVLRPELNEEAIVQFAWPLYLEANIGKVERTTQIAILEELLFDVANKGGNDHNFDIPSQIFENEEKTSGFKVELYIGKNYYINNDYQLYNITSLSIDEAFRFISVWTIKLIWNNSSQKTRILLKFFLRYCILKWMREGIPGKITAFNPTFNFLNIEAMSKEFESLKKELIPNK